jgi:hypothetical protein
MWREDPGQEFMDGEYELGAYPLRRLADDHIL